MGLMITIQAWADLNSDRWRWSNPLPHGNNVYDMLVAADFAVQVGDAGSVLIRRGDTQWLPAITGVTNYLRGTALLGDRILVAGEHGLILWSDDGRVFQPASVQPSTTAWFEGLAASDALAVAVGDFGTIYTSTNGRDWSSVTSGTTEWLRGVAWGGNGFIAVGENGKVLRSQNGVSWQSVNIGASSHLNRVRRLGQSGAAQFLAVGNDGAAFSASSWNAAWTPVDTGSTNSLYDAAMNDLGKLLVGDQELLYQPTGTTTWTPQILDAATNSPPPWVYLSCANGTSRSFLIAGRSGLLYQGTTLNGASLCDWQPLPDSSHVWLWDVMVQNGTYTAVGDLATILTSLDGIVWAREVVPGNITNTVLLGVGGDTNRLFSVGNAGTMYVSHVGTTNLTLTNYVGTNIVLTNVEANTLGLIWTNVTGVSTQNLQGIAASEGHYLVSGAQGTLCWSDDGTNWTTRTAPTSNFLSGLVGFSGGWIACGANGILLRSGPDADTWSAVPLGTASWLYRVRFVGGKLVVVGQNGACYFSPDGTNWTSSPTGTSQWLNDITFTDGTWFITGTRGTLLSSTNLTYWTSRRLPTIKSLFGAAAWDGQLILAGIEGVILRNAVTSATTPVNVLDYSLTVATNQMGSGTNSVEEIDAYELFLFSGVPDQQFSFEGCTNALMTGWRGLTQLELYHPSGTLYLIRTRPASHTLLKELYRTRSVP